MNKVLVLGRDGFIGSHVAEELASRGYTVNSTNYRIELIPPEKYRDYQAVINCTGWNGGIEFNRLYPEKIFYENTVPTLTLLNDLAAINYRGRVINMMASCAYDHNLDEIPPDADILAGSPHPSVACHGYAKRNVYLMSAFLRSSKLRVALCCPGTVFGPRDHIDPQRTKVFMAIVKKLVDARDNGDDYITLWGTGKPVREFIYVKELAEGIVDMLDTRTFPLLEQMTGVRASIRQIVRSINWVVGYRGKIRWDHTKSDGQLNKFFTNSEKDIPSRFEEQIKETVKWYEETKKNSAS